VTHSGVELEDEGEFGTLHLGIGNGITFGSTIRAVGHVDLLSVIRGGCRRTISVDTPITVASPGKVDGGITKCATDATVGGGM
jgi:hypothetical protein